MTDGKLEVNVPKPIRISEKPYLIQDGNLIALPEPAEASVAQELKKSAPFIDILQVTGEPTPEPQAPEVPLPAPDEQDAQTK